MRVSGWISSKDPVPALRFVQRLFSSIEFKLSIEKTCRSTSEKSPVLRRMSGITAVFRVCVVRMLRSELDMRTSRDVCEISAHNGRVEARYRYAAGVFRGRIPASPSHSQGVNHHVPRSSCVRQSKKRFKRFLRSGPVVRSIRLRPAFDG